MFISLSHLVWRETVCLFQLEWVNFLFNSMKTHFCCYLQSLPETFTRAAFRGDNFREYVRSMFPPAKLLISCRFLLGNHPEMWIIYAATRGCFEYELFWTLTKPRSAEANKHESLAPLPCLWPISSLQVSLFAEILKSDAH